MVKNHIAPRPTKTMRARYRHIPQGGNVMNIPPRLRPPRFADPGYGYRSSRCYGRLSMDRVAFTVLANTGEMIIHPVHDRLLSVREQARLQTFPDEYEFLGSYSAQVKQVGNAVPCLLARQLARILKDW